MTRIAIISDIHANRIALEAVIRDIESTGVDELICLGDVATLGPDPRGAIELLRNLDCHCVAGNHEAFLLQPELVAAYTSAAPVVEAIAWSGTQLTDEDRTFLGSFADTLELELDGLGTLFAFHASPRSNTSDILPTTPAAELDALLGDCRSEVLACGHTHLPMLRQHRGKLLLNPGSVGMPFKEFAGGGTPTVLGHAEYGIVHVEDGRVNVSLRRIGLDKSKLRAEAAQWGTTMGAWLATQYV